MTIAQMSHFYALCQSGSYTQAAKQLYITQRRDAFAQGWLEIGRAHV